VLAFRRPRSGPAEGNTRLFLPAGSTWRDPGYLLPSRHDGDRQVSVVELIDLSRGEAVTSGGRIRTPATRS